VVRGKKHGPEFGPALLRCRLRVLQDNLQDKWITRNDTDWAKLGLFANLNDLRKVTFRKALQSKFTILVSRCKIIPVLIGPSTCVEPGLHNEISVSIHTLATDLFRADESIQTLLKS
jgi:hypothetical protein